MDLIIGRLNTLVVFVALLGGIVSISIVMQADLKIIEESCMGQQVFKEEDPVTHQGQYYDVSKNPPQAIPAENVYTELKCQNLGNEWKIMTVAWVGFILMTLLFSAGISALCGLGFRLHFKLRETKTRVNY